LAVAQYPFSAENIFVLTRPQICGRVFRALKAELKIQAWLVEAGISGTIPA
jgi:hypothetical protein